MTREEKEQFILTHTPRQIVEQEGYWFARAAFHEYTEKPAYKVGKPVNYLDFVDIIPDDSFFINRLQGESIPLRDYKLSFLSGCAFKYAAENE